MFNLFPAPAVLTPTPNNWWNPRVFSKFNLSGANINTWTDSVGGVLLTAPGTSADTYSPVVPQVVTQTVSGTIDTTVVNNIITSLSGANSAFTMISIASTTDLTRYQYFWNLGNTANTTSLMGLRFTTTGSFQFVKQDDAAHSVQPIGGSVNSGQLYLSTVYSDGSTLNVRIDGSLLLTTSLATIGTTTLDTFSLGVYTRNGSHANNLSGTMADTVFYSSQLDLGQIQNVERYFANIYAINI